jgi:hypothetical protein
VGTSNTVHLAQGGTIKADANGGYFYVGRGAFGTVTGTGYSVFANGGGIATLHGTGASALQGGGMLLSVSGCRLPW